MGAVVPSEHPRGADSPALRLLGPLAVDSSRGLTPLRLRPKAAALLARVAVDTVPVARRALAVLLFADAEDQRGALRWHLSYLRRHLPPEISPQLVTTAADVAYVGPTDVGAFRAGAAIVIDNPRAAEAFSVLALYRGDLCEGLAVVASVGFDTWLFVEQEQLRRWYRRATEAFASAAIADGRADQATGALARLIAVDPYHEEGHVLLIEALEAAPDPGAAADAYDRYQHVVRRELHAEPRPAIAQRYEPEAPGGPTLPIEDLVSLDQITMHVVEWPGSQPTVLGIHGSGGSAYSLTALGERLAPDRRFLAVDLRGHGFSDKPRLGYAIEDHVSDLRQLVKHLPISKLRRVGTADLHPPRDAEQLRSRPGLCGNRGTQLHTNTAQRRMSGQRAQELAAHPTTQLEMPATGGPDRGQAGNLGERIVNAGQQQRNHLARIPSHDQLTMFIGGRHSALCRIAKTSQHKPLELEDVGERLDRLAGVQVLEVRSQAMTATSVANQHTERLQPPSEVDRPGPTTRPDGRAKRTAIQPGRIEQPTIGRRADHLKRLLLRHPSVDHTAKIRTNRRRRHHAPRC